MKIWRYLQYVWETKKLIKIEEEEVFELLNQDLKEKITVCMNGFILQTIPFFESFDMAFVSELTFYTRKQTYTTDENIFTVLFSKIICQEGERSSEMYYLLSGRVSVMHRQSMTYLEDLIVSFNSFNLFRKMITLGKSHFLLMLQDA